MQKGIFIKDITRDEAVKGIFCVSDKKELLTRHKKPYLALRLSDSTGEIDAKVWDNASRLGEGFEQGDFVGITGRSTEYMGKLQLTVSGIERVDADSVDPALFMPASENPLDNMLTEFDSFVSSVRSPVVKKILQTLFAEKDFFKSFTDAPAAKGFHHAWIHGLLEHTLSVARLADAVCGFYPAIDRDLLVAGALCHDMGKADELSFSSPPIEYSDMGRLLGHIMLGVSRLEHAAERAGIGPEQPELLALKHIILSHHGELEFGSPVLPMTQEALMLHMLDNLDAKMNYIDRLRGGIAEGGGRWTEFQRLFSRYFYLPPREPAPFKGREET
jgi:3'-5' exoribonuclease